MTASTALPAACVIPISEAPITKLSGAVIVADCSERQADKRRRETEIRSRMFRAYGRVRNLSMEDSEIFFLRPGEKFG